MDEEQQRIKTPRFGAHFSAWGSGHTCDSDGPHDGPCICECGITQPYDEAAPDVG